MPDQEPAAPDPQVTRLARMLTQFSPRQVVRESEELRRERLPELEYAPRPRDTLPVQRVVDRTEPLQPMLVDVAVTHDGRVLAILRYPAFGKYGPLPSDPARLAEGVDPRRAICGVLAPYAATECVGRGGAWR